MEPANNKFLDLNRPLPQIPINTDSYLPSNISVKPPSPTYSAEDVQYQLTGSTLTSSANAGKQQFQKVTHELLFPSTPQYSPHTYDKFGLLDPIKYSPSDTRDESSDMPESPYYGVSNMNPFGDERYDQFGATYNRQGQTSGRAANNVHENGSGIEFQNTQGMSQSRSEGNIKFGRSPAIIRAARTDVLDFERDSTQRDDREGSDSPFTSPVRGRAANRSPSPIKYLEEIKEDQMTIFPISPIKRSRSPMKQMFGEHGWLGKSTSMKELPSDEYRKAGIKNWSDKLKQRVGNMTEDVSKLFPNTFHHHDFASKKSPTSRTTRFPVSLGPPLQAKLYSEIELMICATANQYLMTQKLEGRMSIESLIKVTDWWIAKNRPQVLEFMYDQSTQRDLVLANIRTFRFYGPNAENPVSMNAMMLSWRALAKEMGVRTFCTPDSVIKKHMHDCYKILEMLGAPMVTFLAFQEIQVRTLKQMKDKQELRREYEAIQFGVERRWEPPVGKISSDQEDRWKQLLRERDD